MTPDHHHKIPITAEEAELRTGLRAREVFRPARESGCGFDLYPRNPAMRYQLGKMYTELRHERAIEGIRDAFEGREDVFELVAFGRTWGDAANAAERKGYR